MSNIGSGGLGGGLVWTGVRVCAVLYWIGRVRRVQQVAVCCLRGSNDLGSTNFRVLNLLYSPGKN